MNHDTTDLTTERPETPEDSQPAAEKPYIEEIEHCPETGHISKRILYDSNHEIIYIEVYQNGQLELFSHYQASKLHGITQVHHGNGYPMSRIQFENGLMHGLAVSYDEEGALTTIKTYESGKLEGPAIIYYASGMPFEYGQYHADKKEGEFTQYKEDGLGILKTVFYKNGAEIKRP